jgi:hypothetical protein
VLFTLVQRAEGALLKAHNNVLSGESPDKAVHRSENT